LIDDPTFALPYWNWDDQLHGGNRVPSIFDQKDKCPALYNGPNRNAAHGPSVLARLVVSDVINNPTLTDAEIAANNESAMYSALINSDPRRSSWAAPPPQSTYCLPLTLTHHRFLLLVTNTFVRAFCILFACRSILLETDCKLLMSLLIRPSIVFN
jgi:hypothetical protein